jgi:hypothetical protein
MPYGKNWVLAKHSLVDQDNYQEPTFNVHNKLEYMKVLSTLVSRLRVRPEPTQVKHLSDALGKGPILTY